MMCVCVCVYIYIYIYIHTHIYIYYALICALYSIVWRKNCESINYLK